MSSILVRSDCRWEESHSSKSLLTSAHARGLASGHHTKPENVAPSAAAVQSMLKTKTELGVGLPTFAKLPSPAQRRARIRPQACDPSRRYGRFDALEPRDYRGQLYRTSAGPNRQYSPCYVGDRPFQRPISNHRQRAIPGMYRGVARGHSLVLGSAPLTGQHQHFAGVLEDEQARVGRALPRSYIPISTRSSAAKTGWPTPVDGISPYHWSRMNLEPVACATNATQGLAIGVDCGHGYLGHAISHRSSLQESALPRANHCFQGLSQQAVQMPTSLFSSRDSSRQATPELRQVSSWSGPESEEERSIKPLFYDYTEGFGEDDVGSISHCNRPAYSNGNLREEGGFVARSSCRRRVPAEVLAMKRNEANLQRMATPSHEDIIAADPANFLPAISGDELPDTLLPAPLRLQRPADVSVDAEWSQSYVPAKESANESVDISAGKALDHVRGALKTPYSTPSVRLSRVYSYSPKRSEYGSNVINHDHVRPPPEDPNSHRHQLGANSDIDLADESLSEREWRLLTLNDEAQAGTLSQLNTYGITAQKNRRVTSSRALRRSVRVKLRNNIGSNEPRDDRRIKEAGNNEHYENSPLETAGIASDGEVPVSHGKQDPADTSAKPTPLRLSSDKAGAKLNVPEIVPFPFSGPMLLRFDQGSERDSGQVDLGDYTGRVSCQKQLSDSASVGRVGADSISSSNSSLKLPHAEAAVSLSSLEPQPWNLDKSYPWASSSPNIHVKLPEAKDPPATSPPRSRKLKWRIFKRSFFSRILLKYKARSPSPPGRDRAHAAIHDVVVNNDHPDPKRSTSESSSAPIERGVPRIIDDNRPTIPSDAGGPALGSSSGLNVQLDPPCLPFSPVTSENPIEMHSVFSDSSSEEYSRPGVRGRLRSLRCRIVASSGLGVSCGTGGASPSLRPLPAFKTSTESGKQRLTAEGCKSIRVSPRKRMDRLRRWILRRREDVSRLKRRPTRRSKMAD